MAQQVAYAGTGRRKDAVARVRLVPGDGKITVNNKASSGAASWGTSAGLVCSVTSAFCSSIIDGLAFSSPIIS